jgi:hypothetical protein
MNSGFSSPTNSISSSGGIVSFYLVFYSSTTMAPGNSYYIANISGGCKPSGVRTINYTSSGRTWTITIYPSGAMEAFLNYGSPSADPYVTIGFTSLSFNL